MRALTFLSTSILAPVLVIFLTSCESGLRTGDKFTKSEIKYLETLELLDKDETLVLFDGQDDFKTSGNFFTNKRIASYWIDKRDKTKNSTDFVFYADIDTLVTKDMTSSLTYASYLKVKKKNGQEFKVYTDGDSTQVWTFFNRAIAEWKSKSKR